MEPLTSNIFKVERHLGHQSSHLNCQIEVMFREKMKLKKIKLQGSRIELCLKVVINKSSM